MPSFSVRTVRLVARGTCLCAFLLTPVLGVEHASSDPGNPAIPPGQEELLGAMLGMGATLPDDCRLAGAAVVHTIVNATYTCSGRDVVFELVHPSKAAATTTQTAQFAITLQSGSPPDTLADVLVSLIRSREDAFEWKWLAREDDDVPEDDAEDEEDAPLPGDPHR